MIDTPGSGEALRLRDLYARYDTAVWATAIVDWVEANTAELSAEPSQIGIVGWSDARIWEELHKRLGTPGWTLNEGEVTEKAITPMSSFVAWRLEYRRLFLVGDARAHRSPDRRHGREFGAALRQYRSQLGQLASVTGSDFAKQMLAEQYTGLKLPG